MENAITFLTVVGGLVFSVSCALLVEELVFGGLFKIFFQRKHGQQKRPLFLGSADKPVLVPVPVKHNEARTKKVS